MASDEICELKGVKVTTKTDTFETVTTVEIAEMTLTSAADALMAINLVKQMQPEHKPRNTIMEDEDE